MEIKQHFDPTTLSDEQKNTLLTSVWNCVKEYPNYLSCNAPYLKGYRDGVCRACDEVLDCFTDYSIIQGFDPND